jgi:glycosyltransferase involved in cell wall biosynthesis
VRIVVDAMCAEFGGIRTYVEHLLARWHDVYPDDELHVLVRDGMDLPTADHIRHEVRVRRPREIGRPFAQTRTIGRLAKQVGADAVIVTAPTTTVLRPSVPMAVVILDLRHELRPEQFSRKTKLLRKVSYGRTYQLADHFLAISQRSLDDLRELHPKVRDVPATVTHLGADHVAGWEVVDPSGQAITFAHHTNKNPDLVLDGWRVLRDRHGSAPGLLVLGVGDHRDELAAAIEKRGLGESVKLARFLPEEEFQRVMAAAEMIVFPSDFEGFGLPVVEGMLLGRPVVIGPERATNEIAGGHAFLMADWSPESLADAVDAAGRQTPAERDAARLHAQEFTWSRTVAQTRAALEAMVAAGKRR